MTELLSEAGRGIAGLWNPHLWWTVTVGAAAVVGLGVGAHRRELRVAGWPLLVVAVMAFAVTERAVLPVGLGAAGWWAAHRSGLQAPSRPRLLLLATLVAGFGLYGTLPDTEETIALLAALAVVGLAGVAGAVDLDRLRAVHVGALAAVLPWVVIAGDGQRLRAFLAGMLCLVLLGAVAAVQRAPAWLVLLLQVIGTVAASRWVGLAVDAAGAWRRALPVLGLTLVGTAMLWRLRRPVAGPRAHSLSPASH